MKCLIALLVCSLGLVQAFYEGNKNVVQLNSKNFDSLVFGGPQPWLIEFYAPWCGHCQRLVPEYEKASESLRGLVKVGSVNCDDDQSICGRFGIKGFPTIKLFPALQNADSKGRYVKVPKDYNGDRSARSMYQSAISELPNVLKLSNSPTSKKSTNIDEFLTESIPKAILFTTKAETSPMYKALSLEFKDRMKLSEVRDTEKQIVEKYTVTKFPTLVVIKSDGEKVEYQGKISLEEIQTFLSQHALPSKTKSQDNSNSNSNSNSNKENSESSEQKEEFNPEVIQIKDQETFKKECLDKQFGTCLLAFLSNFEDGQETLNQEINLLKEVKKQNHQNENGVRVLWLDAQKQNQLLQKFGLSDQTPTLMLIAPRRNRYRPFMGSFDANSIDEFIKECNLGKGRFFKYEFEPTVVA